MEAKIKHLEFIQGVIDRLATNSFRMKGWAMVLLSALLVLVARHDEVRFAVIGWVPVLIFWALDGYFLWQERLYRGLYDHVRELDEAEIDFSMDTSTVTGRSWCSAAFSRTLVPFYMVMALSVGLIIILD